VDNERRDFPIPDEIHRIVLLLALGIVPGSSHVVPLGKPDLFGLEVGGPFIDVAAVVAQAFKAGGLIPGLGFELQLLRILP
jgi:hypothetical protein